tara:strand:- start:1442 stop:2092 length:651 start_codon:yes stop_codon:yes gene_type:complete
MLFNKGKKPKCPECKSKVQDSYSFCPYCGSDLIDREKEMKDFGMLGKNDVDTNQNMPANFGFTDKLIGSLVNSLAKNLDKQLKNIDKDVERDLSNTEIRSLPNGIKIRIGYPTQEKEQKKVSKQTVSSSQIERMSTLPRAEAKSSVKRLSDKVVYELSTPGVESPNDIFVSKLESGYEVKAIGSKKIYVNSLPINLPLKRLSLAKNKLLVEFKAEE